MNRALLVIDVQNEYFTGKRPIRYPAGSLERILAAWDAARAASIPIVVVQHGNPAPAAATFRVGSPTWELHPAIAARPADHTIQKTLPGSFTGTDLESWACARGVDTFVITGYMTQMCCDTTARQAFHRGFGVEFLGDATGTLDLANAGGTVTAEELHRAVLATQASAFSRVLSTAEWCAQVQGAPMPAATP